MLKTGLFSESPSSIFLSSPNFSSYLSPSIYFTHLFWSNYENQKKSSKKSWSQHLPSTIYQFNFQLMIFISIFSEISHLIGMEIEKGEDSSWA